MKTFTFYRALQISALFGIILFFFSCDKVTPAPKDPNIKKLLFKEIFAGRDTLYFSYDKKDRLTQYFGYDLNGIERKCRFEYDDNNRLVRAFNDYSGYGQLTYAFNYISTDSIKVTLTTPGRLTVYWMLTLNQKGQLIKTDLSYNAVPAGLPLDSYFDYDYDAAGNVSNFDHTHATFDPKNETLLYDDKKSPFYNVVGKSVLLTLIFPDLLNSQPSTFINNLVDLKDVNQTRTPGGYYGYKFIYQYDADGFPTSLDFKAAEEANYPIQFIYFNQ